MSKSNNLAENKTCGEDCEYWRWFPSMTKIIECINPDSDHYKHILSKDHPACLAGLTLSKKWKDNF